MITALPDPPRQQNRICARKGCDKKLQPPSTYAGRAGDTDPWCSRTCCEIFHGVVDRLTIPPLGRPKTK